MPLSQSIQNYEKEREYLDRALASPNGIAITLPSPGQAINLRQRMYKFRQLERQRSLEMYEIGDERRTATVYDNLVIEAKAAEVTVHHQPPVTIRNL